MLNFNVVNIANIGREIIVFHRIGRTLNQFHDKTFFPYFYSIESNGIFRTIDNQKVNKIMCSRPSDVKNRRDENSYEADILYHKRYIIDKITSFGKADIKYSFVDIEVLTKDLPSYLNPIQPISCISCSNNYTGEIKTFYLKDMHDFYYTDDRGGVEGGEKEILNSFVNWIKEQQFDLLLGWNFIDFDWRYLQARYKKLFGCELAEMLSPIAQAKYLGSSKQEEEPNLVPAGLSVCDYLDFYKKIYRTEPSYALDAICQKELKEQAYKKVDFGRLAEEIKEKNINDVKRMINLEKKLKIIDYYDELRRMSMCDWSDVCWNSKMLDMILLKEAKQKGIILPSKKYGQDQIEIEETFEGAYRRCNIENKEGEIIEKLTGLYKDLWKLDLGCYSEDTEILAKDGWKKYNELQIGEDVATFNTNKNGIEFQPILHLNIQKVKNIEMYNLRNSRTDQLLTWNHKVLYKQSTVSYRTHKNSINDWHIQFAKDVFLHHSQFPLSGEILNRPDYDISDNILKIHAWIITEGHNDKGNGRVKNNIYHISQSSKANPKFCKEIDELFKLLKWDVSKYERGGIRKGQIDWNLKWVWSTYINLEDNYKVIPLWMLQKLSLRQLNLLFDTLMKGDGCKSAWCYVAKDKLARDRFQYLCCLIGRAVTNRSNKNVYCSPECFTSIQSNTNLNIGKMKVNYSGIIWCPTVQNGFIIARRKGQSFISGNSAYPQAIINFCLDVANIKTNEGITINKVNFYQNSNALLPTIAQKLVNRKDILKKQLETADPESEAAKDLQIKYDAIKAVVNSLFGVCGLKIFRLFDYRVAAAITFLVRDLLHYVEDKLIEKGMKVIYIDTDSVFVKATENPKDLCNNLIKQWAKEKYNKDKVGIEFDLEGKFERIFIIALCHYKGYLKKAKTGKIKEEIKGIEAKRKDSSNFIREFQNKLIEKIMNEESQEDIVKFINSEKERIKTLPLIDIGFPCKLSKNADEYKSVPIHVRGLEYTKELLSTFEKRLGDSFYWIPIIPFGTSIRKSSRNQKNKDTGEKELKSSEKEVKKDILCYDEDNYEHIKEINWEKLIDRSIYGKCEHIFEALGWSMSLIKEVKIKKERNKNNVLR